MTTGNFDYFLRRLPPDISSAVRKKYEADLKTLKAIFDGLSAEDQKILWLSMKLHDTGFSKSNSGLQHTQNGVEVVMEFVEKQLKFGPEVSRKVAAIVADHEIVGNAYLGELRMKWLLDASSASRIPMLILHVVADGAAASAVRLSMSPEQVGTIVKWLNAGEREKELQNFAQYRLEMMGRPGFTSPFLTLDQKQRLNRTVSEVFGAEELLLRKQLGEVADITDVVVWITYGLVRTEKNFRNYTKLMKLIAQITAIVGGKDVFIKTDLIRPFAVCREEIASMLGPLVGSILEKVPDRMTTEEVRKALKGLPEGESDFFGIPIHRSGNEVVLQVGRLIEAEKRSETRILEPEERKFLEEKGQILEDFLAAREAYSAAENRWTDALLDTLKLSRDGGNLVMVLGAWDDRVAYEAADVILALKSRGYPVKVLTSGKWGSKPGVYFDEKGQRLPEAIHFKNILESKGVPVDFVEPESTHTGENIRFSKKLLEQSGFKPRTILVIQNPLLQRRAGLSMAKQYPAAGETFASLGIKLISYAPFIPELAGKNDQELLTLVRFAVR
ncbi:MAG: YdcF family protein, partial [Candidatus Omnitrophica bacterium]|nr:YdcF family protein [Candidatus Omnitrophota bacterium]